MAVTDLLGVWRRGLLVTPDGRRDDASTVYWLQSHTLCGDIRKETVPAMKAFAGRLSERDGIFRWERTLASYPTDGPPDDGRLSWQGDIVREDGVHEPYWETWIRVARPSDGDYAAELFDPAGGRLAYLLSIGGFAFFGTSAAPGRNAGAFSLSGTDALGQPIALSTTDAPAIDARAFAPAAAPGTVMRLPECDAAGQIVTADWLVAAIEYPFVLSADAPKFR